VQAISAVQKKLRYQDCIDELNDVLAQAVARLFSDEARFSEQDDGTYVWRQYGDKTGTTDIKREKFSKLHTMVFGAIGHDFKSKLVFIDEKVGADEYIQILKDSGLFEDADAKFGPFVYIFMQDGAPGHTATKTIEFLKPRVRLLWGWPPNSPDLNPIEMVWAIMKRALNERKPQTKEEMCAILQEIWDGLD
jgi:hypothetical protein